MTPIKTLWKNHPLYVAGKIELIPTQWVYQYRGEDVSPQSTLVDGTIVPMDELWQNLCDEGMHDPLIMRVGIETRMMRLEAGNHRIQLFHQHNIPFVPLTVQLRNECGPHLEDTMNDGSHNFDARGELILTTIPSEYVAPSEAFRSFHR